MNKQKGFTVIESLVAIAILVAAVTGATTAAQSGISLANFSKDQVIAFNIAQEGIEQLKNMRDENNLNGRAWLYDIAGQVSDACYFGKVCTVDILENSVIACSGGAGSCEYIRQASETGFYGYDNDWDETKFKREITLTQINSNEVAILVKVTWTRGSSTFEFRARDNILNW